MLTKFMTIPKAKGAIINSGFYSTHALGLFLQTINQF